MMEWIITEDKLPEKDGDYLVTIPLDHTPYVHILGFHNGQFYGDKGEEPNNKRILAWMELPEPYRKGEDNERGEWICKKGYAPICSVCGKREDEFIEGWGEWEIKGESHFCPNCGAKMKGAEDV